MFVLGLVCIEKRRPVAIVYQLDFSGWFSFQVPRGSGNHPLGKPCCRKRICRTRVTKSLYLHIKWANVMLETLDGFVGYKSWSTGIQGPRFYKWLWIFDLEKMTISSRHSNSNLLILLTFNALLSLRKVSICRGWFIFGVWVIIF